MNIIRQYIRQLLVLEYATAEDFEDVEATARMVHMGQKRRDGSDYIMHPLEVKKITARHYPDNYMAQLLALLHDTMEDVDQQGNLSQSELRQMIRGSLSDPRDVVEIMDALEYMTHDKREFPRYEEYLSHVFRNPLAAIVKISDLIHNLSHNPSQRQIEKYKTALSTVPIPGHIKKSHHDELMSILEA